MIIKITIMKNLLWAGDCPASNITEVLNFREVEISLCVSNRFL